MAILDAPALARAFEIAPPIPDPPPVMTILLPARDKAGFLGLIAA